MNRLFDFPLRTTAILVALVLVSWSAPAAQESGGISIQEPSSGDDLIGKQRVVVELSPALLEDLQAVECFVDGQSVGRRFEPPFYFEFDAGDEPRSHTIRVHATRNHGQPESAEIRVSPIQIDFNMEVREIQIQLVALDASNHIPESLKGRDFRLFDGETELKVRDVWPVEVPIRLAVLVDYSSSMYERLDAGRRVVHEFVRRLGDRDQVSMSGFLDSPKPLSSFSEPSDAAVESMRELRISHLGYTGIYDSARQALRTLVARAEDEHTRALLIVTDGFDTVSKYSPDEVSRLANDLGVPIYVVGVRAPRDREERSLPAMERLLHRKLSAWTRSAWGRAMFTTSGRDLDREIENIFTDLRTRFAVSFTPATDGIATELTVEPLEDELRLRVHGTPRASSDGDSISP